MNAKNITDTLQAVAALEPDIALALGAYNLFRTIWMATNPGKTEADFQNYLQATSTTNVDTTAVYLRGEGYVETPEGSGHWSKPSPTV